MGVTSSDVTVHMSGETVQFLDSISFEMAEEVTDAVEAAASQRWYYVDPSTGSTVGPANAYQLAGMGSCSSADQRVLHQIESQFSAEI